MTTIAIISSQAFSLLNFRGSLIRSLVTRDVRVFALAPDYDNAVRQQVQSLGAEPVDYSLSRTGINPLRDTLDAIRLTALLLRLRPDITLCYFVKPVIYGTIAAWIAKIPLRVVMIEGLGFAFTDSGESLSVKRRLLRRSVSALYRTALKHAHQVIFLNVDDMREFVQGGLVDQVKSTCLGGIGVDLMEWPSSPPVTNPVTFLLVARLLREKGVVEFVKAAKYVRVHHPETRFVLVGGLDSNPGSLSRAEVESWVREGLIEWPGQVRVRSWIEQASVFVLPSYREGVPRSTQEAMAMARPIITTDAPGCRETVIDGGNGFIVPVRDVDSLVKAMLRFISHPELIEPMGLKSRELAEERFDVHKINLLLLRIMGVASEATE